MEPPELKLGTITAIWKSKSEWLNFCQYLDTMEPEGMDSDGQPIKLSRYARFLKLYVDLYHKEKQLQEENIDCRANEELKIMVMISLGNFGLGHVIKIPFRGNS